MCPYSKFKITELSSQTYQLDKLCKYFYIHKRSRGSYGLVLQKEVLFSFYIFKTMLRELYAIDLLAQGFMNFYIY